MHTVVQIIAVIIANINVIGGIPVRRPVLRPRVNHHERIATVLEARVTANYDRLALDAKPVSYAEIETETSFRNVVAAIAATLRPGAMVALPIGGAILLPGGMSLPSALRMPTGLSVAKLAPAGCCAGEGCSCSGVRPDWPPVRVAVAGRAGLVVAAVLRPSCGCRTRLTPAAVAAAAWLPGPLHSVFPVPAAWLRLPDARLLPLRGRCCRCRG